MLAKHQLLHWTELTKQLLITKLLAHRQKSAELHGLLDS